MFGHIHEARGAWQQGKATWASVSYVDFGYRPDGPELFDADVSVF